MHTIFIWLACLVASSIGQRLQGPTAPLQRHDFPENWSELQALQSATSRSWSSAVQALMLLLLRYNPAAAFSSAGSVIPAAQGRGGNRYADQSIALHMSETGDSALPTVEMLRKDPFMKQVGYGAQLASVLNGDMDSATEEQMTDLLTAQLSHSDGIRGFFVSYLTAGDGAVEDEFVIPTPLTTAMTKVDQEELVPLACMNVIMPTAMVTMHTDSRLSESSSKTAARGAKFLMTLKDNAEVQRNMKAIYAVATGDSSSDDQGKIEYWQDFFKKWGYAEQQSKDIAAAARNVIDA